MIYTENFKMGLKDIGKDNKIKNRAILEFLENIGAYQSDLVGYGAEFTNKTGLAWVLLDWKLKVLKRAVYGDILKIKTWGRAMNKASSYRDFEIYNQKGELCAIATSKWAMVDIKKGKIVKLSEEIIEKYEPEEKSVFENKILEKIEISKEDNTYKTTKYKVNRKDIDLNGHMHNLYYLDLVYEALPEDIYINETFDNVRIHYKKEIKPKEILNCDYIFENEKHKVCIYNEDRTILHAIGEVWN